MKREAGYYWVKILNDAVKQFEWVVAELTKDGDWILGGSEIDSDIIVNETRILPPDGSTASNNVDCRALLSKYIAHITSVEGTNFIPEEYEHDGDELSDFLNCGFTKEEIEALNELGSQC